MEESIEKVIYEETEKRLKEMDASEYQFPKKADSKDVILMAALAGASCLLIVLCLMGVIQ